MNVQFLTPAPDARWDGIVRPYEPGHVERLRGSVHVEQTLAVRGAERFWQLLQEPAPVTALGALTGGQATQMVRAGLKAVYVSGWQVAADGNLAGEVYPDQSLYPSNSGAALVRRVNNALRRADQIASSQGRRDVDWVVPVVADAESGFGGAVNAFETMKSMIEAGAAAVHFEDQLGTEKRNGGKVLVPTSQFIRTLSGARLAADVLGVPTVLIARTDALAATFLSIDADETDQPFVVAGKRTPEGHFRLQGGIDLAVARALAYAPYADVLWCIAPPDLEIARSFAEGVHAQHPGKPLAFNLAADVDWRAHFDDAGIRRFQAALAALGYRFQFLTVAGFRSISASMFQLASGFAADGMSAYAGLQAQEAQLAANGYTAADHQSEVGAAYFRLVAEALEGDNARG
jgi:isocitrate lyase